MIRLLLLCYTLIAILCIALADAQHDDLHSPTSHTSPAPFPPASKTSYTPRGPLVMLSTMDGTVSAFDANTGDVLFTYTDSRPAVHSWAAPGHPEYVPSLDGLLYRIDRQTDEAHVVEGKFITRDEQSSLANALPSSLHKGPDAVVLTHEESSVLFIDMRTGRLIHEMRFKDTETPEPLIPTRSDNIIVIQRTAVAVRILETTNSMRELANATLVHTEPTFWQQGRCIAPSNPNSDRYVAYTTEARDRIVVRNIRTGQLLWAKDVAAPVVEAHGMGGVRIAASYKEAKAISTSWPVLPHYAPQPPVKAGERPKNVVIAEDGGFVYAMLPSSSEKSPDGSENTSSNAPTQDEGDDDALTPQTVRAVNRSMRSFIIANMKDSSTVSRADRVLAVSRLPQLSEGTRKRTEDDMTFTLTTRQAALALIVLVVVGIVGYMVGSRPRRLRRKRSSANTVQKRQRAGSGSTNSRRVDDGSDRDTSLRLPSAASGAEDDFYSDGDTILTPRHGDEVFPSEARPAITREVVSSTGSNNSSNGYTPIRSLSGWMSVGCLQVSNKMLGTGSHGTCVFEGKMMPGERKVAVKRLLRQFYESARKEISLLVELDEASPHVVRYFAMEEDSEFIYVALELCASSLSECIQNSIAPVPPPTYKKGPPPAYSSRALRQLLQGLAHLHKVGVVHRDVKPQNVLITRSVSGIGDVKLADVGLALRLAANRSSYTAVTNAGGGIGTTGWRAPEVLSGGRQTKAVDIFAAGCVVSSVLTGEHPYGKAIFGRDGNIAANKPCLEELESLDLPEATDIVQKMIDPVASRRPTAEEALLHPFFWTDATKLSFLVDISDRLYDLRHHSVRYTENLDRYPLSRKYCSDWLVLMDMDLLSSLGREYENTASGLLRVIRNKRNHYSELSSNIRKQLGPLPEDRPDNEEMEEAMSNRCNFLTYFTSKVPQLLMCVYRYALENKALINQPHFARYGLQPLETDQIPLHPLVLGRMGSRGTSADRSSNHSGRTESGGDGDGEEVNECTESRRTYHRHELVDIQAICGDLHVDMKRRLEMFELYQPTAFERYKKRLLTNEFSEMDFSEEERASLKAMMEPDVPPGFPPRERDRDLSAPPGFPRVAPRRGNTPSPFAQRQYHNHYSGQGEDGGGGGVGGHGYGHGNGHGYGQGHGHGQGTPHVGTPLRRGGNNNAGKGTGIAPTISQFSGEERVVDFGALRRRT